MARTVAALTSPRIEAVIRNVCASMPSRCSGPIGSATPLTDRMRSSTFAVGYSSRISVELGESNAKTSMPASVSAFEMCASSAARRVTAATSRPARRAACAA